MTASWKLLSMEIHNMKNVEQGTLNFINKESVNKVTGIYGQNGSGKTTFVDCLDIVRNLLLNERSNKKIVDILNEEKIGSIKTVFRYDEKVDIEYFVSFKKEMSEQMSLFNSMSNQTVDKVKVIQESLIMKELFFNAKPNTIISYRMENKEEDFSPKSRFPMSKGNRELFKLIVRNSVDNDSSIIFSKPMQNYLSETDKLDSRLKEYYQSFFSDLPLNIFVYTNDMYGLINIDSNIPMIFSYRTPNGNVLGRIHLPANRSGILTKKMLDVATNILEQINQVLPYIIPDLTLDIRVLNEQLSKDNERVYNIEVMAQKVDTAIPLRCESDGVKKIVAILSSLISVYGSPNAIVAIDELDSGIFEFLLGEIIDILNKGSKGQLIFTSHNLRPLEVLDDKSIIFTTANSKDRYLNGGLSIKKTNNLRDVYLRNIQISNDENRLYDKTNSFRMKQSFKKASKHVVIENLEVI